MTSTERSRKFRAEKDAIGLKRYEYRCYPHEKVEHDKLQAKLVKKRKIKE